MVWSDDGSRAALEIGDVVAAAGVSYVVTAFEMERDQNRRLRPAFYLVERAARGAGGRNEVGNDQVRAGVLSFGAPAFVQSMVGKLLPVNQRGRGRRMSGTQAEAPASAGVIEQAQEKVGAGVEQAKSSAGSFIQSQVDERATQLGEQLHGAVQALRQAEQTMEQEGTPGTQLVDRAATQAERAARYLSQSSGARLLNDFEGLGRRNPWAIIGGGIVLGLVGARFLKASSSRRFEEYRRSHYNPASAGQLPPGRPALHETGSTA